MPTPAAVRVDHSKSNVVQETRAMAARISPTTARRLRGKLLQLQFSLIQGMVENGVDVPTVTALSHCFNAINAVELLTGDLRARL
jgi:hypothetical protein